MRSSEKKPGELGEVGCVIQTLLHLPSQLCSKVQPLSSRCEGLGGSPDEIFSWAAKKSVAIVGF